MAWIEARRNQFRVYARTTDGKKTYEPFATRGDAELFRKFAAQSGWDVAVTAVRAPAPGAELEGRGAHVEQGMADGALGLSTGLIYEPGKYAPEDELVVLAGVAAAAGGIYTTHMRNEGVGLLESVAETVRVAERTGARVQISHHKASGRGAWGLVHQSLALIDAAVASGLAVMADQ